MAGATRPLRGRTALRLIRDLALDSRTRRALAEEYGVTPGAITQFAQRHAAEIEAARADLENAFAALWIADKAARLAEYQRDVEDLTEALDQLSPEEGANARARLYDAKHRAMRSAAEELGQLAAKVINATQQVTYRVEGVDLEALR